MAIQDRILQIMQNYGMNSGQFASKLGVQPSNISHILSGRNKPSLDFVTKILKAFPDIDYKWLVMNQGAMLSVGEHKQIAAKEEIVEKQETKEIVIPVVQEEKTEQETEKQNEVLDLFSPEIKKEKPVSIIERPIVVQPTAKQEFSTQPIQKHIEKIVVFYSDNTFEEIEKR